MNYEEAVEYIHAFLRFGMRLGLGRMAKFLSYLGNPQDKLKFIHIAGTNGKGSTTAMTARVLEYAGYKTGMYISPYVIEFRERMQINGEMIPKEKLVEYVERVKVIVDKMKADGECPTEFEVVTAIALCWFADSGCDIVCFEVGLGGRFDATNVISSPLMSVICSISFDHVDILGDTIEKIAEEKCGIIKPGCDVISYPLQDKKALEVIKKYAAQNSSKLIIGDYSAVKVIKDSFFNKVIEYKGFTLTLGLPGEHQTANTVNVMEILLNLRSKGYNIPDEAIINGITDTRFPARLEKLSDKPLVVLDGAHNPSGINALSESIDKLGDIPITLVIGMLSDKDYNSSMKILAPKCKRIFTLTPPSPRALSGDELKAVALKYCNDAESFGDDIQGAVYAAIEAAMAENGAVIMCGSLYLAEVTRKAALKYFSDR